MARSSRESNDLENTVSSRPIFVRGYRLPQAYNGGILSDFPGLSDGLGASFNAPPPTTNVWADRASRISPPSVANTDLWATSPDERGNDMANRMSRPHRQLRHPSQREIEMEDMGTASSRFITSSILSDYLSKDQSNYFGYTKANPAPAARQSSAIPDVIQRGRFSASRTSTQWNTILKPTISEDLSERDKDHGAKLRYLQKRLGRETLKSPDGKGPQDNDSVHPSNQMRRSLPWENKDQLDGHHKEAK